MDFAAIAQLRNQCQNGTGFVTVNVHMLHRIVCFEKIKCIVQDAINEISIALHTNKSECS
jgi:hypothetical protein